MYKIKKYIKKIENMDKNTIFVIFIVVLLTIIILFINLNYKKTDLSGPYGQEKQNIINDVVKNSTKVISKYNCKEIKDKEAKQYCFELKSILDNQKDKTKYIEIKYCKRPDGRFYPSHYCNLGSSDNDEIIYEVKTIPK